MKELKVGDKVLVPMVIISKRDGGDFPYTIGYDTARINMSEKRVAELQTLANGDKTYEDGMRDAWKLAGKLFNMSGDELDDIIGKNKWNIYEIMERPPHETAEKIAEWEDKREFRVGDVVKDLTIKNAYGIVSHIGIGETFYAIWNDGSCGAYNKNNFVKTGRMIDIAGLLAQIGGTDNE